ncbi:hypothetical protein LNV23_18915 [Paucibacter sp. DJ1R-11]|uniref:hypothetical protein n=1 Tax=Paucibacter sp. DJ1R-11 TaxID=2893556 RepID=UPI0021E389C3|nr:hypothetical protein [Paucibacter sp. DJ1R-11]MCV2365525.1 hypothetical protein [Paucibacter sp. DJ1R-11]
MAEPTSSGAAGLLGWKLIGGAAGFAAGGASLAAVVVMIMTPPRSVKEWAVGLISTVVCSVAGGAWLLHWLGMDDLAASGPAGLATLFGLCFACGLPGWALVRAIFSWMAKRKDKDIAELAGEVRSIVTGGPGS